MTKNIPIRQRISLPDTRRAFAEALNSDHGLYIGYEANIAMYLHDQQNKVDYLNKADRDMAAEDILNILFSDLLKQVDNESK